MKKVLAVLAVMIFAVANAYAMPIYIDLSGAGIAGSNDGVTGVFDKLGLLVQTTSTGNLLSPVFTDEGDVRVDSLKASIAVGDTEGLGSAWELTGGWRQPSVADPRVGLSGNISSSTYIPAIGQSVDTYNYNLGYIDLYAQAGANSNYGSTIGVGDDSGFLDGTLVATFSLTSGEGSLFYDDPGIDTDADGVLEPDYLNRTPDDGEIDLVYKASFLKSGFWYGSDGTDLSTYLLGMDPLTVQLLTHSDTDQVTQTIDQLGNVTILSEHDGSAYVTIPEPTSLLLLGGGLLGLAGLRKRKNA